jgi:isoleucyl-tRNA synthetase
MYQNLVRSVDREALESVHHTTWPQADEAMVDEDLLERMALTREVVGLGHSARNSVGIKLRQPLAQALIHAPAEIDALDEHALALIEDELNVKQVIFVDDLSQLVDYRLLPVNQVLGPRFGSQFPAVRQALSELDPLPAVRRLRAELPLQLEVEGQAVELAPDEVLIQEEAREGLAVASDDDVTVAVDAELTPELEAEGLAREVIRRVQSLRKEADFNLDDRIVTAYQAEDELAEAVATWEETIATETLSVELRAGEPDPSMAVETFEVDGHVLTLGVRRVDASQ